MTVASASLRPRFSTFSSRLKDFRRMATRYDENADNLVAADCIAATISY